MGQAKQILTEAGLADSHWGKRIIAAEAEGGFNTEDLEHASNWVTCACGRVTADIPRSESSPRDEGLADLGIEFCDLVQKDDFPAAARTLIAIEQRAAVVAGGAK